MSVVIVKDQQVLWAKGYGFANVEKKTPGDARHALFHRLAHQDFAATLILRLVEQGELDIDEPIARYSGDFKDDSVRIKHLPSHTSAGTPGEQFQYDGNRFDYLTAVIEKKAGKPFVNVVVETFFDPLGMSGSVPYHDVVVDADKWLASLGKERLDRYQTNLSRLAEPYTYYGAGETVHATYPPRDPSARRPGCCPASATWPRTTSRSISIPVAEGADAGASLDAFPLDRPAPRLPYGLGWDVTDHHGTQARLALRPVGHGILRDVSQGAGAATCRSSCWPTARPSPMTGSRTSPATSSCAGSSGLWGDAHGCAADFAGGDGEMDRGAPYERSTSRSAWIASNLDSRCLAITTSRRWRTGSTPSRRRGGQAVRHPSQQDRALSGSRSSSISPDTQTRPCKFVFTKAERPGRPDWEVAVEGGSRPSRSKRIK